MKKTRCWNLQRKREKSFKNLQPERVKILTLDYMVESNDYTRYVILLSNVPGREMTEPEIREHVEFLKELDNLGKLELCGPFTDSKGGMVIIKAASINEAEEIAESDPFVKQGVKTYELRTMRLSCSENNHLGMG